MLEKNINLKLSVCIVTYNHEKYIAQCIQSIVEQVTDFSFEVIVCDDKSTDSTPKILKYFSEKYVGKVRVILNEANVGVVENFRIAHASATAPLIAHVDGDDYWLPGKLDQQISLFEKYTDCSAIFTNSLVISDAGIKIGIFSSGVQEKFDVNYLIEKGNFLHFSSIIYKAIYRESILASNSDFIDFEIYIKLCSFGSILFLNKPLAVYRAQSATSVIAKNSIKIRHLYLIALSHANKYGATQYSLSEAWTLFTADVLFHELKIANIGMCFKWLKEVYSVLEPSDISYILVLSGVPTKLLKLIFKKSIRKVYRSFKKSGSITDEVFFPR